MDLVQLVIVRVISSQCLSIVIQAGEGTVKWPWSDQVHQVEGAGSSSQTDKAIGVCPWPIGYL